MALEMEIADDRHPNRKGDYVYIWQMNLKKFFPAQLLTTPKKVQDQWEARFIAPKRLAYRKDWYSRATSNEYRQYFGSWCVWRNERWYYIPDYRKTIDLAIPKNWRKIEMDMMNKGGGI